MTPPESIESKMYEHVLGQGQPSTALLNSGVLSTEWTEAYLRLLKEAVQKCKGHDCLPNEIVAA